MPKKFAISPEQAFEEYKLMGKIRSVAKLVKIYQKKYGHEAPGRGTLSSWSTKHNWVERCAVFDDAFAAETEKNEKSRYEELKSYDLRTKLRIVAALACEQMTDYLNGKTENVVITTPRDLRNIATSTADMVRLSRELEGSVQEKEVEEAGTSNEERQAQAKEEAERLLSKLTSPGVGSVN